MDRLGIVLWMKWGVCGQRKVVHMSSPVCPISSTTIGEFSPAFGSPVDRPVDCLDLRRALCREYSTGNPWILWMTLWTVRGSFSGLPGHERNPAVPVIPSLWMKSVKVTDFHLGFPVDNAVDRVLSGDHGG